MKKKSFYILLAIVTFSLIGFPQSVAGQQRQTGPAIEEGFISTDDGTRLFFRKVGNGRQAVIIPGGLFLYPVFTRIAGGRTLIFYDMRGRGRSDALNDEQRSKIVGINDDVRDVDRVRQHFKLNTFSLIGYSYLGLMTVMYAMENPERIERIVQLGPVPLKFGTKYPDKFVNTDDLAASGADPAEVAKVEKLKEEGYDKSNPKEFCERQWQVTRYRLVGSPANVGKLGSGPCEMPNEWLVNLMKHFEYSFASVQRLDIPRQRVMEFKRPVLTIHGMKDRNAAYGAGREWASLLPNSRLLTVKDGAHQVWIGAEDLVFPAIDSFLKGQWPAQAERISEAN